VKIIKEVCKLFTGSTVKRIWKKICPTFVDDLETSYPDIIINVNDNGTSQIDWI